MPSRMAVGSPLSNVSASFRRAGRAVANVSARRSPLRAATTAIAVLS